MAESRIAWTPLPPWEEKPCQAPRHAPSPPPAAEWLVALDDVNGTPELFTLCTTCVDLIAIDLGTTAHEGAVSA